ncbi:MAG: hypothetical protein NZ601_03665 [candidate division WOR-3 bacterium]|nr:hypothetical protein [candidate division WOR-3 bacterium]MCX7757725.1 hypothetical protein [candidate division WOR-3 bacterium]MDW7988182.1 hypothetical protein [candidate division WOR-3 bacterium]
MKKSTLTKIVIGAIFAGIVGFVVSLLVIKLLWSWIVPELFPKAVEDGLIVRSLSWLGALKVAIIIGIFSGLKSTYRCRCECNKNKEPDSKSSCCKAS